MFGIWLPCILCWQYWPMDRNLDSDHGRNVRAQNIWKAGSKKNIWTRKRRRTLENKNKQEDKGPSQGTENVKLIKSVRLGWYGHVKRLQNRGKPKQIVTATVEGTRKRARPRKRWTKEFEWDWNKMRTKKQARNSHRRSGMEEDRTGSRGLRLTVALEKE